MPRVRVGFRPEGLNASVGRVDGGIMRRSRRWLTAFVGFVLALSSVVAFPDNARATGGGGGHDPQGFSCGVYPIALKAAVAAAARPGSVIDDILNGAKSGHEGWLTWTGDVSEPALARSLTPP